jgi:opacity protein-like surface antigen
MKKIIIAYLCILSPVTFADQNWNSYYIGASAGAAFGKATSTDVSGYQGPASVGSELKYNTNGSQLNMFGGKNWLLSNNFLFGIEAAIGHLDISNKKQYPEYVGVRLPTDSQASTDNGMFVSLAGRFGKVFNDNTLLYAKGGFIQTDIRQSYIDEDPEGCVLSGRTKTTRNSGPFVGLGLEHSIYKNLNIRTEYIYYQFGSANHVASGCGGSNNYSFNEKFSLETLNLGAIYNF